VARMDVAVTSPDVVQSLERHWHRAFIAWMAILAVLVRAARAYALLCSWNYRTVLL